MAGRTGTGKPPRTCSQHIVAGGLPNRGKVILKREEALFPMMVGTLREGVGGARGKRGGQGLTMELLEDAFTSQEIVVLRAAAFLAGRCQPDAREDQQRLTALLENLVKSLPVSELDIMARPYVEAAMSLALRGQPDAARRALLPVVTEYANTNQGYLAAFYLAQLGDPSGYPEMLKALHSKNEHDRLMAVRHLIAFKPFDGQNVRAKTVDVRAQLLERLKDRDAYVRVEVPFLLEEAGITGLKEILGPVAKSDRNKDVREAAGAVMERLK